MAWCALAGALSSTYQNVDGSIVTLTEESASVPLSPLAETGNKGPPGPRVLAEAEVQLVRRRYGQRCAVLDAERQRSRWGLGALTGR